MRILVTGGAGFIGRHLVRYLLKQGHTVTIFDNFSNSTKDSVSDLTSMGAISIEGDVTDMEDIVSATRDQEIVVHLAAKISVSESIKNPQETMRVNVDGAMNVLEGCKKNSVRNTILVSSAAVYGDVGSPQTILTEDSRTNPLSPYGKSKLTMEQMASEFVKSNKMSCVIFRIFNIYGKGQSDEYAGVMTRFTKRIQNNESLVIYGDGLQTRDFVSIDDVIVAFSCAMSAFDKHGRIYNIGSGKSVSIKDLAGLMLQITGKKLEVFFEPAREGDIRFSQASIERARKELGYNPRVDLVEGMKNYLGIISSLDSTS